MTYAPPYFNPIHFLIVFQSPPFALLVNALSSCRRYHKAIIQSPQNIKAVILEVIIGQDKNNPVLVTSPKLTPTNNHNMLLAFDNL
jgi:hypothetical protein